MNESAINRMHVINLHLRVAHMQHRHNQDMLATIRVPQT